MYSEPRWSCTPTKFLRKCLLAAWINTWWSGFLRMLWKRNRSFLGSSVRTPLLLCLGSVRVSTFRPLYVVCSSPDTSFCLDSIYVQVHRGAPSNDCGIAFESRMSSADQKICSAPWPSLSFSRGIRLVPMRFGNFKEFCASSSKSPWNGGCMLICSWKEKGELGTCKTELARPALAIG